jgi:hypothetical protein
MTSKDENENQEAMKKLDNQIMDLMQAKARLTVQTDRTFMKKYGAKKQVDDRISFTHSTVH